MNYISIFGRADEIEIYSLRTEKRITQENRCVKCRKDSGEELYQEPEIVPLVPGLCRIKEGLTRASEELLIISLWNY